MSIIEQKMQEQMEGAEYERYSIYSLRESFSKKELKQHIAKLEYQLSEINEHGLGDSDTMRTKWIIERNLKIFKGDLNFR